ncbi:protein of unknown function [Vibrio tapetis subsp. tapetis]|uniref:Uncharacterized protein n=1 Tax=Vibrio tapetis subsp. tapetis TaxID=1671868 RepID=A0A2N8ZJQ5_9VIBR|nr:protein of unknown function [Vibrio tapetis subsp. tapetis]
MCRCVQPNTLSKAKYFMQSASRTKATPTNPVNPIDDMKMDDRY